MGVRESCDSICAYSWQGHVPLIMNYGRGSAAHQTRPALFESDMYISSSHIDADIAEFLKYTKQSNPQSDT